MIEGGLPLRIAHEQGLDVGGIGGGDELLAAGADEVGGMALGVAVRRNGAKVRQSRETYFTP